MIRAYSGSVCSLTLYLLPDVASGYILQYYASDLRECHVSVKSSCEADRTVVCIYPDVTSDLM